MLLGIFRLIYSLQYYTQILNWLKILKKKVTTKTLNLYDISTSLKEDLNKDIYFDNIHFNSKGHECVSEIIFEYIEDKLK